METTAQHYYPVCVSYSLIRMDVSQERRQNKVTDITQYRPKKALEEQNDTKVLKFIYECLKYTGLTPFSLEKPHVCANLIFLIFFALVAGDALYCFIIWTAIITDISTDILFKLIFAFNIPFAFFCILAANFRVKKWKEFVQSIGSLEESVTECGYQCKLKISFIYAQVSFLYIVFSIEHIIYFTYRVEEGVWNRLKQTAVWMVFYIYRNFVTTFVATLSQNLRRRYLYINEMVKTKPEDAENAMVICKRMQKVVSCMNQIFGWHLFFHFGLYVILLLGAVSNIIITRDFRTSNMYFFFGNTVSIKRIPTQRVLNIHSIITTFLLADVFKCRYH